MESNKLLPKTIRLTPRDKALLSDIIIHDARISHGSSEALRICFEDVSFSISKINWQLLAEKLDNIDCHNTDIPANNDTTSFLVPENIFNTVYNSFCKLGTNRPNCSRIARLCICHTWLKLQNQDNEKEIPVPAYKNKEELLSDFKELSISEKLDKIYQLILEKGI